jgi:Mycothiol maleylpyruvate isomerase N-terminal domain
MGATDLLRAAYDPLLTFAAEADEHVGWSPTELPGWAVRDLIFHLATDAQRALVALARPSRAECDTDEISYWRAWQPGTEGALAGLRGVRISASAWSTIRGPADLFVDTATAVLAAAERSDPTDSVSTQGHTLTVDALLRTLAVEAAVHHLDLRPALSTTPAAPVLEEVRRVLDGLLGEPAPADWDDVHYVRLGTGRQTLSATERREIGSIADRFPLFG